MRHVGRPKTSVDQDATSGLTYNMRTLGSLEFTQLKLAVRRLLASKLVSDAKALQTAPLEIDRC